MKWPNQLSMLRHGESAYNILSKKRKDDPDYQEFISMYNSEWEKLRKNPMLALPGRGFPSEELFDLASKVIKKIRLDVTDFDTPLTKEGERQAFETGKALLDKIDKPHVILVSPYLRTRQTLDFVIQGNPELKDIEIITEDRIREQEHGLRTYFNDQALANLFHPIEGLQAETENRYTHRYLGGESMMDVKDRTGDFLGKLTRDYQGYNVLLVTHHLLIMAMRSRLERWSPDNFLSENKTNHPKNCSLTIYKGDPTTGNNGRLNLESFNEVLWR